jgi:hypothetical protein
MFAFRSWKAAAVALLAVAAYQPVRAHTSCSEVRVDGPKTCNCTDTDASVQVCHSVDFKVTVGNSQVITVATGQSNTTCITQTVPANTCVWIRYRFECCRHETWLGTSWSCSQPTSGLHSAPATPADCS